MKDFLLEAKFVTIHMGGTSQFIEHEFVQLVRGKNIEDAKNKLKQEIEEKHRIRPGSITITNLTME